MTHARHVRRNLLRALLLTSAPASLHAQSASPPVLKVVVGSHALVLRADSTVIGWGRFRAGQLGEAPVLTSRRRFGVATPVAVPLPGKVIDIAVNEDASYALLSDGSVVAWGANGKGELGIGSTDAPTLPNGERGHTAPQVVRGLRDVVQIGAMRNTAYALLRDGTMRAWGSREYGALGDGVIPPEFGANMPPAMTPVVVSGVSNVRQFSANGNHVVALTTDGRIFAWGVNTYGELGTGEKTTAAVWRPVEMVRVPDVVQAVAGAGVTGFLKRDGTVWMVGSTTNGLFGIPEEQTAANGGWSGTPRAVPGVRNAVALTMASGRHALALLKDGTVRGWGNSDWGQVGNGVAGFFVWTPVIPKITGVTAVWATGNHSFAVTRDGGFWMWGSELGGTGLLAVNQKLPVRFPLP